MNKTFVLSSLAHDHLGVLQNIDETSFSYTHNFNSANEISFDLYYELNGVVEPLWDKVIPLKYIYIPEDNDGNGEYYCIDVQEEESANSKKTITGTSAAEVELGQILLHSFNINNSDDLNWSTEKSNDSTIDSDSYTQTIFYNSAWDPDSTTSNNSLLHRALSTAPHYTIDHVDESLVGLQRTFSIDGSSIYDALTGDIAEAFHCMFVFDSVNRTVSAYDLYTVCQTQIKDNTNYWIWEDKQVKNAYNDYEHYHKNYGLYKAIVTQTIPVDRFGNVNMNSRYILQYDSTYLTNHEKILKSWTKGSSYSDPNYNAFIEDGYSTYYDQIKYYLDKGYVCYDTVIATYFDNVTIGSFTDTVAASGILQASNGTAVMLSRDCLYNYITDIIAEAVKNFSSSATKEAVYQQILEADRKGLTDSTTGSTRYGTTYTVSNMIAGIGEGGTSAYYTADCSASLIPYVLTYIGKYGCLQQCTTHTTSVTCGYRADYGEFYDPTTKTCTCPQCGTTGSKLILKIYGDETNTLIDVENMTDSIQFSTDTDAIKNCFQLKAGDDLMTSAVAAQSPNGSLYLYYFNPDTKADMPTDLVSALNEYDEEYDYYQNEYEYEGLPSDLVEKYNALLSNVIELDDSKVTMAEYFNQLTEHTVNTIPSSIVGYPAIQEQYDEFSDFYEFLTDSMMRKSCKINFQNATAEANKLIEEINNGLVIALENPTASTLVSSVNNAITTIAKVYVYSGYVKVTANNTSSWSYDGTSATLPDWTGYIEIKNYSDTDDTVFICKDKETKTIVVETDESEAKSNPLTLTVSSDYATFVTQKLIKKLQSDNENSNTYKVDTTYEVPSMDIGEIKDNQFVEKEELVKRFQRELTLYGLTRLENFRDEVDNCVNVLSTLRNNTIQDKNQKVTDFEQSGTTYTLKLPYAINDVTLVITNRGTSIQTSIDISNCKVSGEDSKTLVISNVEAYAVSEIYVEYTTGTGEAIQTAIIDAFLASYARKKELINEEIDERSKQVAIISTSQDLKLEHINTDDVVSDNALYWTLYREIARINKELNMKTFLSDKGVYEIFCAYRREDEYSNDNFISDGLNTAQLYEQAKEFIKDAKLELYKSGTGQHSISTTLYNIYNLDEFKDFRDKIKLGNFLRARVGNNIYRLRLISIGGNESDTKTINVDFSDVTVAPGCMSDLQSLLSSTQQMATSYSAVTAQANKGEQASQQIDTALEDGLNSALMTLNNGVTKTMTFDANGLLGRAWDEIAEDYSPEQMRITNNILCFTEDNWNTVSLGLGKHNATYYDKTLGKFATKTAFGLSADFVTAGTITGSTITSGYIHSDSAAPKASWIDLDNSTFSFGGGAFTLTYKDGSPVIELNGYVDDDTLNTTIEGVNTTIGNLKTSLENQIDSKIETYYQADDPSKAWTTDDLKGAHVGDYWYDTTNKKKYQYTYDKTGKTYSWEETKVSDVLFDAIDGKSTVYYGDMSKTPEPYISEAQNGDYLIASDDAHKGITYIFEANSIGSGGTWKEVTNYKDITEELKTQIDSKIQTWCQDTDPSRSWSDTEKEAHKGDLWYYNGNTITSSWTNNTTYEYKYDSSTKTYNWVSYNVSPDLEAAIKAKVNIFYGKTTDTFADAKDDDYLVDAESGNTYKYNSKSISTTKPWDLTTDLKSVREGLSTVTTHLVIDGNNVEIQDNNQNVYAHYGEYTTIGLTSKNYIKLDSDGMYIYDGSSNVLASYGATTTIGKTDGNHMVLDTKSLQLIDSSKNTYFQVSDLRDTETTILIKDTSPSIGITSNYCDLTVDYKITSLKTVTQYKKDGTAINVLSNCTIQSDKMFRISNFTNDYRNFYIEYYTNAANTIGLTFGNRKTGTTTGVLSVCEGGDVSASGIYAHAEGFDSHANGKSSHAQGEYTVADARCSFAAGCGTVADGNYMTAIGHFNKEHDPAFFVIGNGTGSSNRHNALSVAEDGSITINEHDSAIGSFDPSQDSTSTSYSIEKSSGGTLKFTIIHTFSLTNGTYLLTVGAHYSKASDPVLNFMTISDTESETNYFSTINSTGNYLYLSRVVSITDATSSNPAKRYVLAASNTEGTVNHVSCSVTRLL